LTSCGVSACSESLGVANCCPVVSNDQKPCYITAPWTKISAHPEKFIDPRLLPSAVKF
jgi:hypothetical protein